MVVPSWMVEAPSFRLDLFRVMGARMERMWWVYPNICTRIGLIFCSFQEISSAHPEQSMGVSFWD